MLDSAVDFALAAGLTPHGDIRTRRGKQDLIYRVLATKVIEKQLRDDAEWAAALRWYFQPRPRYSLLTELGRCGEPTLNENGLPWISGVGERRLIWVARMVVEKEPTDSKHGIKLIRFYRAQYDEMLAEREQVDGNWPAS